MKAMNSLVLCLTLLCGVALLGAQNTPQWQWAVCAGGTGMDKALSTTIDSQGNQYVTGWFHSIAVFGNNFVTTYGSMDIFVAKLDPSGNWLWAARAGGPYYDNGYATGLDIAVDDGGNAYVTGWFEGRVYFGCQPLMAIKSCSDVFIAKLDRSGNWLWAVQAGGQGEDSGLGIAVDGSGNAYVTGIYYGTAYFGYYGLTENGNEGFPDIFVVKLDSDGNWLWVLQAGGTGTDQGFDVVIDGSENIWLTGFFTRTGAFGSHTLSASGYADIFVAKLDPDGNWLSAVKAGGNRPDFGTTIAIDSQGNQYVVGNFESTATFGSHSLTARGMIDIFVAKLDPSGNWLWAVQAGGTNNDYGYGITLDGSGHVYIGGYYRNTATFGSHSLTSYGDWDIFVSKLECVTPVEDELAPQAVARLYNACPNPLVRGGSALIKADIPKRSTATLNIFNLRGQVIARHKLGSGSQQVPFSGDGLPAGIYLYSLQCGDYRETRKLVLMK